MEEAAAGGQKNPMLAAGLSLILPGLGHYYAGETYKAFSYAGFDALAWYGHWFTQKEETELMDYAKIYAKRYAGAVTADEQDDLYLEWLYDYISSDAYNQEVQLSGKNIYGDVTSTEYLNYVNNNSIAAADSWNWVSQQHRQRYGDIRFESRQYGKYNLYVSTALVLNRLVSAIDAARAVRAYNRNKESKFSWHLEYLPAQNAHGITFRYRF